MPIDASFLTLENATLVSVDPGVRTFNTFQDNFGNLFQSGTSFYTNMLYRLRYDVPAKIQRARARYPTNSTDATDIRMNRKLLKEQRRIEKKCIKKQKCMHRATAALLTAYNYAMAPLLEASAGSRAKGLPLSARKKARVVAHGKYNAYLKHAMMLALTHVLHPGERYSTRVCGRCGACTFVGVAHVYHCPDTLCKHFLSRDGNPPQSNLKMHLGKLIMELFPEHTHAFKPYRMERLRLQTIRSQSVAHAPGPPQNTQTNNATTSIVAADRSSQAAVPSDRRDAQL